jgi:hypothetical protein
MKPAIHAGSRGFDTRSKGRISGIYVNYRKLLSAGEDLADAGGATLSGSVSSLFSYFSADQATDILSELQKTHIFGVTGPNLQPENQSEKLIKKIKSATPLLVFKIEHKVFIQAIHMPKLEKYVFFFS